MSGTAARSNSGLFKDYQHGDDVGAFGGPGRGCCGWAAVRVIRRAGKTRIKDCADVVSCCTLGCWQEAVLGG